MSDALISKAKALFEEAVDWSLDQRAVLLAERCGEHLELRALVEELLRADDVPSSILDTGKMGPTFDVLEEQWDQRWVGRTLGNYRLRERIGQGGMGEVYRADRADAAFEKEVAVKILAFGMDRRGIRRFARERQILAQLEHPNIARLLDGGASEEGVPYLVMELVLGLPITDHCRTHSISSRKRISLLQRVAETVQHAHQNLVVHRDLKPSNILVTSEGIPKLLDFGIAKLIEESGAEPATVTERLGRAFTPGYASPEQFAGQAVTTACDVYSLGVILHELLVGRRPPHLERGTQTAPGGEMMLPSRPSLLFQENPKAEDFARSFGNSSAAAHQRSLRGDIDTILTQALAPEPQRRYGSARELADDLGRYLEGRAVNARRAGFFYRLGKWVTRYKGTAAAIAFSAATLLIFAASQAFQSKRLAEERDVAEHQRNRAERVTAVLLDAYQLADPKWSRGEDVTAREILDNSARRIQTQLADEPELQSTMMVTLGSVYLNLGLLEEAETLLQGGFSLAQSLSLPVAVDAETRGAWARLRLRQGNFEDAEKILAEALTLVQEPQYAESRASLLHLLGQVREGQGDRLESTRLHREALEMEKSILGESHPQTLEGTRQLATALRVQGKLSRAKDLYVEVIDGQRIQTPGDHVLVAETLIDLARILELQQEATAARSIAEEALAMSQRLYGGDHPQVARCYSLMGSISRLQGQAEEALGHYREALRIRTQSFGADNPRLASEMYNLATLFHRDFGFLEEAEPLYRQAVQIYGESVGDEHLNMAFFKLGLGRVLSDLNQGEEAEGLLRQSVDLFSRISPQGPKGRNASSAKSALAGCLMLSHQYQESEALLFESYPVLVEAYGKDHRITLRAARRLNDLYQATARPAEADLLQDDS